MNQNTRPRNLVTLREVLPEAERARVAVGSFSPRYLRLIRPILRACRKAGLPAIVQISQKELLRGGITLPDFSEECFLAIREEAPDIPVVLHLDHTKSIDVIESAMSCGFSSVMIDASEKPYEDNVRETRHVVRLAEHFGASVEAELGRIGTTDFVETDADEHLLTVPEEAGTFVRDTGVDALAVSVGTAHGHYLVRQPRIDYERLRRIRQATGIPLVLHGGSGVPAQMMRQAIGLEGGGISKVNIATDLEAALLEAIGMSEGMRSEAFDAFPESLRARGISAVERVVSEKLYGFLTDGGGAVASFRLGR